MIILEIKILLLELRHQVIHQTQQIILVEIILTLQELKAIPIEITIIHLQGHTPQVPQVAVVDIMAVVADVHRVVVEGNQ